MLVSLNIIQTDKCINEFPIVFYWNKETNIITYLKTDENFKNYIIENCFKYNVYTNAVIKYIYIDEDNDSFIQNSINVQELFDLPNNENDFYLDYVKHHFRYLYKCSYKTDYVVTENPFDNELMDIYNKIKKKHPNKIVKSTVLNYIRSVLIKEDKFNNTNCNWIINKLSNIITEV